MRNRYTDPRIPSNLIAWAILAAAVLFFGVRFLQFIITH